MKLHFEDASFSFELLRNVGYAVSAGSDIGDCLSTAARIAEGDYESWFREWSRTGDRLRGIAELSARGGRTVSAREAYLRASTYYRMAVFYVRMTRASDPDVRAAYHASVDCFAEAAKLLPGVERIEVPYEGTTLRGYFFRALPLGDEPRPTLVFVQGYDSTVEEVFFACADAATRRGYNVISVDGPGQGWAIHEQGLPFRFDYEAVVRPVIDFAVARADVDAERVAIEGFSLGGILSARAAAFEPRAKALIQYNAVFDYGQASLARAGKAAEEAWARGDMDAVDAELRRTMDANPSFRWTVSQGLWTFKLDRPSEWVAATRGWTLQGAVDRLTMPVLLLDAEGDGFFGNPPQPVKMWNALRHAPKTIVHFTADEGAEEHCQVGAYLLNAQRTFDWLDHVLQGAPAPAYPAGVAQSAAPGDATPVENRPTPVKAA